MKRTTKRPADPPILAHYDRRISVPPLFVDLTGSHTAAIMLAQTLYWHRHPSRPDRWFYKNQTDWFEETRLTWRQVNRITDVLISLDFIEIHRTSTCIWFRLKAENLAKAITDAQNKERINKKVNQQNVESTKRRINKRLIVNRQNVDSRGKRYIGTRARRLHTRLQIKEPPTPSPQAGKGSVISSSPPSRRLTTRQQRIADAKKVVEVELVMRRNDWSDDNLAPTIFKALEQYRREHAQPISDAAKLMIHGGAELRRYGEFLRHTVTPRKFITSGMWANLNMMPIDWNRLNQYRTARVGNA